MTRAHSSVWPTAVSSRSGRSRFICCVGACNRIWLQNDSIMSPWDFMEESKTLILCPCTWTVLEVIGGQVPICRNNCKHLWYKWHRPFLLIRKTSLLIGGKSIPGIIGEDLSALMGRNLVLFFVRFSSYPLLSVLWLETWFIAAIHLGGSSITPRLLGDRSSSCLLWIRQKSCQSSKAGE